MSLGIIIVGSHDKHIHAVDVSLKRYLWTYFCDSSCFSSPLLDIDRNCVYICLLSGKVLSLDVKTGLIIWQRNLFKPIFSSPCLCDGFIAFGCVDGFLYAMDFNGNDLWKFQTNAPIFSSPVYLNCMKHKSLIIFGSNDHRLYCLDENGVLLWKFQTISPIYASVCILRDSPYTSHHAFNKKYVAENTERLCKKKMKSDDIVINDKEDVNTSKVNNTVPGIEESYLVVASTNGDLFILSANQGNCLAEYHLPGEVFSSPVTMNDKIIIGCRDDNVYCLHVDSV